VGHSAVDYRLRAIYETAIREFHEADSAKTVTDEEYKRKRLRPERVHLALERQMKAGVVLLMITAAVLEQMIFSYAVTFLDSESYEKHLGRLPVLTKWIILPQLCQNKEVTEDGPAINALNELIQARNAVVHPKTRDLGSARVQRESARFLSACRNVKATVDALREILQAPAPGG